MVLLWPCLALEEEPRLAVMIGKAFGSDAQLLTFLGRWEGHVDAFGALMLGIGPETGGFIIDLALGYRHLHMSCALQVVEGAARLIDPDLMEVGAAQPLQLGPI